MLRPSTAWWILMEQKLQNQGEARKLGPTQADDAIMDAWNGRRSDGGSVEEGPGVLDTPEIACQTNERGPERFHLSSILCQSQLC